MKDLITFSWLEGYRTYVLGTVGVILMVAQLLGWVQVPDEVWVALGFGSVLTLRASLR